MQKGNEVFIKNGIMRGLTQSLQRLPLLFVNNMRGRSRIKYGMTSLYNTPHLLCGHPLPQGARETACGFTLIELLVVVLIIGILAAVALPQYKVAVAKSRVSTMLSLGKAVADAEEVYYLAHGEYAMNVKDLDVDIPGGCTKFQSTGDEFLVCGNHSLLDISVDEGNESIVVNYCPNNNTSWSKCRDNRDMQIVFYLKHVTNYPSRAGKRVCLVHNNSKLGKMICANFNGVFDKL